MVQLTGHREAMERLWRASAGGSDPPALDRWERCHRRFPDRGGWLWVRRVEGGEEEPVVDPMATAALDARWSVVERAFRSYGELSPRIRAAGESGEPRGVEMWEWSCIGLHQLWEGWRSADGVVRAELKPAQISLDDGGFEPAQRRRYEISYPLVRVEALAEQLEAAASRRGPAPWRLTVASAVARHGLGPDHGPAELLGRLVDEGLARRYGCYVRVLGADGLRRRLRRPTFDRAARRALAGTTQSVRRF